MSIGQVPFVTGLDTVIVTFVQEFVGRSNVHPKPHSTVLLPVQVVRHGFVAQMNVICEPEAMALPARSSTPSTVSVYKTPAARGSVKRQTVRPSAARTKL